MNIAMYSPAWPPGKNSNGIVTYCGIMAEGLTNLGCKVYIITPHINDELKLNNIEVIKFDISHKNSIIDRLYCKLDFILPGFGFYRAYTSELVRVLERLDKEVSLDIFEMEESQGWAREVIDKLEIATVIRLHGPHFLVGQFNKLSRLDKCRINREKLLLKKAKHITSPSRNTIKRTVSYYSLDRNLSKEVIYNPIDEVSQYNRWSLESCNKKEILFVGRFDEVKGGHIMLKSFSILTHKIKGLKLTFVGPDRGIRLSNGKLVHFDEYRRSLDIASSSQIEYLGSQDHDSIEKLRRRAFITVVSSLYDNFPNTVLEAMAYGCPLIATKVGGIPEMVIDKETGLLANCNDEKNLADSIEILLNDHHYAAKLASSGYKRIEEYFSIKKLAKYNLDYYKSIL